MRRPATLALLCAGLAGCASADAERIAATDTSSADACFSARLATTFRPFGRDAVDVEISRNRVYRLTLGAGCFDIDWANSVALRSRGASSFICSAADAELIVPSSLGPDRCLVTGIRRLGEAELQSRRN